VDLCTRRQLTLLLLLVLIAGAGLGIDRWRRAHPELAERLEALDRAPAPPPPAALPTTRAVPTPLERAATPPAVRQRPGAETAMPLDLNRATRDELDRLPGIGPGLAARIVDARESQGRFGSVDDLRRVRGIGHTTLERVRPLLAVGPAP
jgi:competence ComEA-like helix-hairpin-helix protein